MPMGWDDLSRELDLWAAEDRVATFWWRDDDAAEPVPAFVRLLHMATTARIGIAIAAIPAAATKELAAELAHDPRTVVVQHGFAHRNHAAPGQRAVECGGDRPVTAVMDELQEGRHRLEALFGSRFAPILVPPWNRIDPAVLANLAEAGYSGISVSGTARQREPFPGLVQANTHCDVLTWRGGCRFVGSEKALGEVIDHLRDQRTGAADADEPTGLLTHHLAHDEAAWQFVADLIALTQAHPAARWIEPRQVFDARSAPVPTGTTALS